MRVVRAMMLKCVRVSRAEIGACVLVKKCSRVVSAKMASLVCERVSVLV